MGPESIVRLIIIFLYGFSQQSPNCGGFLLQTIIRVLYWIKICYELSIINYSSAYILSIIFWTICTPVNACQAKIPNMVIFKPTWEKRAKLLPFCI